MTTIRCMYREEPKFPVTDQHPDAKRVYMCGRWIDYLGDEPTVEFIQQSWRFRQATTIRCMYREEPKFPATDQHPDAKRVHKAGWWIDYVGEEPAVEYVQEVLAGS